MKSSGVEVLMSEAFGCITSITNGKAWTNALRAYRLIIAVLLRSFYTNLREDIPGAGRLPGGSQRTLDWETLDGLPHRAYTVQSHAACCGGRSPDNPRPQ